MSNGNIQAGGAYVRIFTKNADFTKGLATAAAAFRGWGGKMTRIAATIGTAISTSFIAGISLIGIAVAAAAGIPGVMAALAKKFAGAGQAINSMADSFWVSASAMSAFDYVASQTGQSVEKLMEAMSTGNITGQAAMRIRQLRIEAQKLGLVWSAMDIQSAVMLQREFLKFGIIMDNIANRIGSFFAPAITVLLQVVSKAATSFNSWLRSLTLIGVFNKIAAGMDFVSVAAGDVVRAVGKAINGNNVDELYDLLALALEALKINLKSFFGSAINWAIDAGAAIAKAFVAAFEQIALGFLNIQSLLRKAVEIATGQDTKPGEAQDVANIIKVTGMAMVANHAISSRARKAKIAPVDPKELADANSALAAQRSKVMYELKDKKVENKYIPDLAPMPPSKQSAQGTFSGFGAGVSLGASGYEQRTAENTGRMVALMQQMLSQQRGFK